MKKIILLISLALFILNSFGQNYEIDTYNGQTVTTCSGTFFDSGGAFGSYSSGESYSITFCPSTTGTKIDLDFSLFDVNGSAAMQVFDGPNNTFNSFGTFSDGGFSPVGMGVAATPTNTSGCLTVEWTSGPADMGWEAEVSCIIPCQTVMATLLSSSPAVNADGFIDICPGDSVTFIGGGLYPENNLIYTQGNNTSSFVWSYGNGIVDSASTNIGGTVYDSIAGYFINLTVYDSMGCESTNILAIRIRTSTQPIFAGTVITDSIICDGEIALLDGEVETVMSEVSAALSLAGTTFLPDGSGASYTTSLVFDAFSPGQTLTTAADFLSMCAVMEHSYLGDLDITLECPNGTVVVLKSYPGCLSTYLGEPIDIDVNLNPGVGYEYCWSPPALATYGNMNAECGSYSTMPAGSYEPLGTFNDFVGCPLNGAWTIEVTDNLLSDNGYIFEWGINFNPNILPTNFNYEPQIIAHDWNVLPAVVVADSGQDVTVAPGVGMYSYSYEVTDDFGCVYDTTLSLEVLANYVVNFPQDTVVCSDATLALDASNNGNNVGAEYAWFWDFTGTDTISTADNFLVDKPGFYWVDIPNIVPGCGHTDSIWVIYNEMELDLGADISGVCSTNQQILSAATPLAGYPSVSYSWSTGAVTGEIAAYQSGIYSVSVARGNCVETDEIVVEYDNPLFVNLGNEIWLCQGDMVTLDAGYAGQSYVWSTGNLSQFLEVSIPGVYSLTVTNACGQYTDDVLISEMTIPTVNLGGDEIICNGQVLFLDAEYNGPGPAATYLWSNGNQLPSIAASNQGFYSVTISNQCGNVSDQIYLTIEYPLAIDLGPNQVICPGDTIILDAGYPDLEYYWSNNESTQSIEVYTADSYAVDVINSCGTFSDIVTISIDALLVNLGPDTTLCPGGTIDLDAQNPGAAHYSWSNGDTTQTISVNQAGIYTVNVTSVNNCTDEDEIEVILFNGEVNLGEHPGFCEGSTTILDAGFPGSTYEWNTGLQTQTIEVGVAGNYSVTVHHFCGDMYDNVDVIENALPIVDFGTDTVYITTTQSATLDAGSSSISYLWSTNETSQIISVNTEGWYTVTVTDDNGCEGVGQVYVYMYAVGIDNPELNHTITVYPNPARERLFIQSENEMLQRVELYNSLGELVKASDTRALPININLHNISEGIYFIRIHTVKGEVLIKPVSVIK
ncbi:MAG: T9SS type A sorting domain-containing protein [Bacteroidota bacterium]|nr:T9SS type A sorting domain-containing protein [Bacteroidota bacterium]